MLCGEGGEVISRTDVNLRQDARIEWNRTEDSRLSPSNRRRTSIVAERVAQLEDWESGERGHRKARHNVFAGMVKRER